jgi:hypothetical protein
MSESQSEERLSGAAARGRDLMAKPATWLVQDWQWPYATAFAACFLLALLPVVWSEAGVAGMLIYAQLPVYMLHQLEEHAGDRFRLYVNQRLAGGREALGRSATFLINLLGVWALIVAAILLAYYVEPGLGLIAVYLTGVNAVVHLLVALRRREYNPGLATAVALFVPLTIWAALEVNDRYDVSAGTNLALGVSLAAHLAIVAAIGAHLARDAKAGTRAAGASRSRP